jgi:2-furoyl-CoA dehydrogenase large subunit
VSTATGRQFRFVGKPFAVLEDRRFVRGRGRYIADMDLPGMLHLGVASAPVAHAKLLSVNVEAARRAPGVVAVLTGQDLVERMQPIPQNLNLPNVVWYPLAIDKIRFAGEWTAAIVATSRAAAEDAAELVEIEYEELPPVVDPEQAMSVDAPLLHDAQGSNIAFHDQFTWGEVDQTFASAAHTFSFRFRWNRHAGVPLETFGAVAAVDRATGILDLWASHQNPQLPQEAARVMRLPSHRVRVHQDIDVGGSYGSKRGRKQMYLTCVAATVAGKPVKFIEDRLQNLQAGDSHGPDRIFDVKLAVTDEGLVEAMDLRIIDDVGAYAGRGAMQTGKPITACVGPYHIKAVRYSMSAVLTNKTNQAPFRGFGQAPHNFVLERSFDRIARALGIDPVDIRLRNYIRREEFPYQIPSGATYDSGDYHSAMQMALHESAMEELREQQAEARRQGRLVGIGIAGCLEPSGGHSSIFGFLTGRSGPPNPEAARIQVDQSGHVIATIGFQSAGQAHESMVTQIVCEELGVQPTDVTVVRGDSLAGIVGAATTGSRMTLMLGTALVNALGKVKAKAAKVAGHVLEVDPQDIVVDGTRYYPAGSPDQAIDLTEVARVAYRQKGLLPDTVEVGLVEGAVFAGFGVGQGIKDGRLQYGFPSYAFSVHIPVVEIDPSTFEIKLTRYVVVHDCGQVINPLTVNGMVWGGIAHGIGGALYEHFAYDQQGQLVAASFMDYLLPTASEVPTIELHEQVTPTPLHPYGAKGTAEGGYMTAPAAIASAVEDALAPLGVDIGEIPITPKLLARLSQQHGRLENPVIEEATG